MAKKDLNKAAQKATAGFFSATPAEEPVEIVEAKKDAAQEITKAEDAPKKKRSVKKGFSFRGNPEDVMRWQNYGMAVKNTHAPSEKFCVDELWCAAIEDYIKKHPLTGKAKELYDEYTKS